MKNGAEEKARRKFHCYVTRRYCWIQNDSLCEKLDRISCAKRVMNYYKHFELDEEFRRFPLKMYEDGYDLHCNLQSAIENKLQMMYIPNLARNRLFRSHIEKYYENRIYLDFWKLTRRIKSCFRGSSVLMKQVSLFELIRREKEFKKNRLLKSGVLRQREALAKPRKKNWREFAEKNKTASKSKRAKRKKGRFDFNLNFDFLDPRLEGVETQNITGLLNNLSRLVTKSNIELEILNNAEEVVRLSFMKGPEEAASDDDPDGGLDRIGWDSNNPNLSEIQHKMTRVKGDLLRKKAGVPKKYVRSSIMKKNPGAKNFVITKGQNFSQKFSKKKDTLDDANNKMTEPRSINSSYFSPERRREKNQTLFDSKGDL